MPEDYSKSGHGRFVPHPLQALFIFIHLFAAVCSELHTASLKTTCTLACTPACDHAFVWHPVHRISRIRSFWYRAVQFVQFEVDSITRITMFCGSVMRETDLKFGVTTWILNGFKMCGLVVDCTENTVCLTSPHSDGSLAISSCVALSWVGLKIQSVSRAPLWQTERVWWCMMTPTKHIWWFALSLHHLSLALTFINSALTNAPCTRFLEQTTVINLNSVSWLVFVI
jgi:hypothetical protein